MRRILLAIVSFSLFSSWANANLAPVNVEVLQTRLDHPWSLAFLPDNRGMLITLKGGQLRHWQAGGDFPIRWLAYRKCGQTGREVCWTSCWRLTLPSRAASG